MITREAIRLWKNTNSFIQHVDMQYDDQFAQSGAKIGQTLRIRLPNDYTVRTGAAAQPQDTQETNTTLTMATQKGVDLTFSSVERALKLDDFSKRILAPAVNNLVGAVALDVMSGVETGCSNFTANLDGGGNVISPVAQTWLNAGAILDNISAPAMNRRVVLDPLTEARTVGSLTGLLNPAPLISEQYKSARMKEGLGFEYWMKDQTVLKHTTAAWAAMTVSGADQTGLTLVTAALTGPLSEGDIIEIDGVYAVNRITKQNTGVLAQFVITADAAVGATSLSIYPAIVPPVGGANVQYQTVTASPANGASITPVTPASSLYRKNIAFVPEAITIATADLELPRGVQEAAREQFDGLSMRMVSAYNIMTDQFITRLDILYGYLFIRPEWVVAVGDAI